MFADGRARKETIKNHQIPSAKATSENSETSGGVTEGRG